VEWDKFWVNILGDIDICFIAFVYMRYLDFHRRLKHAHGWVSCSCSCEGAASYSGASDQEGEETGC
jgi:hypothetical protein